MPETPKPVRTERFTMLEPRGPNNPSPEALASRIVEPLINEHFTLLEPKEANPPALPPAVLSLASQLAAEIATLDERARAAALSYVSVEVAKRLAG